MEVTVTRIVVDEFPTGHETETEDFKDRGEEVDFLTTLGTGALRVGRQGSREGVDCLDCYLMNFVEPGLRFCH